MLKNEKVLESQQQQQLTLIALAFFAGFILVPLTSANPVFFSATSDCTIYLVEIIFATAFVAVGAKATSALFALLAVAVIGAVAGAVGADALVVVVFLFLLFGFFGLQLSPLSFCRHNLRK